jgi:hypothetical protein
LSARATWASLRAKWLNNTFAPAEIVEALWRINVGVEALNLTQQQISRQLADVVARTAAALQYVVRAWQAVTKPEPRGRETPWPPSTPPKRGGNIVGAQRFTDAMTITVLRRDNPKRPGTKAHQRFELYENGMTVGAFREKAIAAGLAKGGCGQLSHDVQKGFISVKWTRGRRGGGALFLGLAVGDEIRCECE